MANNTYSCGNCGTAFDAATPDDVHCYAAVDACMWDDYVKRQYECPNCNKVTVLFWHLQKHDRLSYKKESEALLHRAQRTKPNWLSYY